MFNSCLSWYLEALLLMINNHGGSINILTGIEETPLHYAMKNNHLSCTILLLRHGANKEVKPLTLVTPKNLSPWIE